MLIFLNIELKYVYKLYAYKKKECIELTKNINRIFKAYFDNNSRLKE